MQKLSLNNGLINFAGHISLEKTQNGIRPWRLSYKDVPLYYQPGLIGRASAPSGVRLNVISDTRTLTMTAAHLPYNPDMPVEETLKMDLIVDGKFHQRVTNPNPVGQPFDYTFTDIPEGEHRLEVWLDVFHPIEVQSISIDEQATAKAFSDTRPKWLVYGSSITHCGSSGACYSPSRTWPATVARTCDLDLLCLGFGGNCCLDPQVARTIRDLPPQCAITLKLGINMLETHTRRTFLPAALGFVLTVRDGHPTTPLLVCSPIYCPRRFRSGATGQLEEQETVPVVENGLCLQEMRTALRSLVESLQQRGDSNLHYLDGRELLGPHDDTDALLPDGVHPSERGYELMGERFAALGFGKTGRLRTSSSRRAASCKL